MNKSNLRFPDLQIGRVATPSLSALAVSPPEKHAWLAPPNLPSLAGHPKDWKSTSLHHRRTPHTGFRADAHRHGSTEPPATVPGPCAANGPNALWRF